jgi:hypothetical protein
VIGYVLHVAVVPWIDFSTKEVKRGKDGQPRTQEVVTLRVVKATAVKGDGEALVVDEEAAVWLNGHRRWDWGEAKKAAKGLRVGDKVKITYAKDEPSKAGQPKKVWAFEITKSTGKDADIVAECEEAYHRIAASRAQHAQASGSAAAEPSAEHEEPSDDDSIPF